MLACVSKQINKCVYVQIKQVAVACVCSMLTWMVLYGACRHAKLMPFEKNLGELATELLPQKRWQLATNH